jgi:hypothetical protein
MVRKDCNASVEAMANPKTSGAGATVMTLHRMLAESSSDLTLMIVKQQVSKSSLKEVQNRLRSAIRIIDELTGT